jgi:hypothetical protein
MKVVVSHPFGNPNVYNATLGFYERSLLAQFHTCLFAPLGTSYRSFAALRGASLKLHPCREVFRLALNALPIPALSGRRQGCVDWVARGLDLAVAKCIDHKSNAVYCYEDSAFETFRIAKSCGVRKFYELTSGYQDEARAVADEEVRREKGLRKCFISFPEPQEKVVRKRLEVLSADHIVCASTYCCSTLRKHVDVPGKVSVLPYGCNCSSIPRTWSASAFRGPLKLVFVGRLEPRKGLHYLFQALENLIPGCFMLTLAGRWVPGYREWLLGRYRIEFKELGQISRFQAMELMRQSDLLVFPSLFEGFGLVLLEAMGCGIPILASERTGAPDIIEDKREGFLVKAGCSEDIARVLWHVLDERRELAEMGIEAHRKAISLSWSEYRRRLSALVTSDVQCAQ